MIAVEKEVAYLSSYYNDLHYVSEASIWDLD